MNEVRLSDDQIASFHENGYLSIDRITTDEEIADLRELYAKMLDTEARIHFEGKREDGSTGVIEQVIAPELTHPELLETDYFRNARAIACQLMDIDEAQLERANTMIIYKPPGAGRDTPWHHDEAYWSWAADYVANALSCWMPLDDVSVESGCMHYLPKSQEWTDDLTYRRVDGPEPLVLADDVDVSDGVPCPIPAGGATFHHCRTLHFAGANTADIPRRAISALFMGPHTPREVPAERPWLATPLGQQG